MNSSGKINSPEFMKNVKKTSQPTYITKASKK